MRICLFCIVAGVWLSTFAPAAVKSTLPPSPSPYVMDALTATDHAVWIATEGSGVYRCEDGEKWEAMHDKPGFPDTRNVYALVEDAQGRIWAGTDHQGVAVWNGREWQSLSRKDGLPGERVFALAASDDAVAVATSGGIGVYRAGQWEVFNRGSGMADDVAAGLAFDAGGQLVAASACGGLELGLGGGQGARRANVSSPWYADASCLVRQPFDAHGSGIASNLGNAVAVDARGTIWYGGTCGIARSEDGGRSWRFLRGRDYDAKNKGLDGVPIPEKAVSLPPGRLLLEEYVTALLPVEGGVWVGFREAGAQLVSAENMQPVSEASALNRLKDPRAKWVRRFLVLPSGAVYAATYGGGLQPLGASARPLAAARRQTATPPPVAAAELPDTAEMSAMAARMQAGKGSSPAAGFWFEDWLTRGNWCERYGRLVGYLCAAAAPADVRLAYREDPGPVAVAGMMGPHRRKGDYLRHWLHEGHAPKNPNVLWNPEAGTRTEAEWDDHGEEYPKTFDGPDVWVRVDVPEGMHLLSLYFYNPNGHVKRSGYRDYVVELREGTPKAAEGGLRAASARPVLARTRVFDFAGCGVWKNFRVQGGKTYLVRVCRNNSFNTILNGVFLSEERESSFSHETPYDYCTPWLPPCYEIYLDPSGIDLKALELWTACLYPAGSDGAQLSRARLNALQAYRFALRQAGKEHSVVETWRGKLQLWEPEEEKQYAARMSKTWGDRQRNYIHNRSVEVRPFSPGVVPLSLEELQYADRKKIDWMQYRKDAEGKPTPDLKILREAVRKDREERQQREKKRKEAEKNKTPAQIEDETWDPFR